MPMIIIGVLNVPTFMANEEVPITDPPNITANHGSQQQLVARRIAKTLPKSDCTIFIFLHTSAILMSLFYFKSFRRSCAFRATKMVLKLIKTAPIAGLSTNCGYNTPAANGMAKTLYPVAHQRF